MKKLFFTTIFLALVVVISKPVMARADVDVHIGIPFPPAIVFAAPPALVVIPETYVYAVPDIGDDVFFYNGWWWRPWDGRWYRSRHYNSGWVHYRNVPSFYSRIPHNWRNDYRAHRWRGHQWNYRHIPQQQLQRNWRGWENRRHWEKQNYWGVQGLRSRPQSREVYPSRGFQQHQSGPQFREGHPSRESAPQRFQPQSREGHRSQGFQPQRSGSQYREIQRQHYRPQSQAGQPHLRESVRQQHSQPQHGNPERGRGERH